MCLPSPPNPPCNVPAPPAPQAQAGPIQVANGGPNNQQVCVTGVALPFGQPPPITYTMTATINPATTADCTPGGTKTYSVGGGGCWLRGVWGAGVCLWVCRREAGR